MKNKNLKAVLFIVTILLCVSLSANVTFVEVATGSKPILKFEADGKFKIVEFADLQDGPNALPSTITLMNKILDCERPNLVVLAGDNIDGNLCPTRKAVYNAMSKIARPMEIRGIPWAVVFGNHDNEGLSGMTKEQMMNCYTSFKHNVSQIGFETDDRIGNYNIVIQSSKSTSPAFNIYFLDSGMYTAKKEYAYITNTQIDWYKKTAAVLNSKGRVIHAIMFFHIPLQEYFKAYTTGLIGGERLEAECPQSVNTGLFDAIIKVGDVRGIFVGHDHLNSYCASLKGIILGYGRSAGYRAYFKAGVPRGARVIQINESNPSNFQTWMRQEWDPQLKQN